MPEFVTKSFGVRAVQASNRAFKKMGYSKSLAIEEANRNEAVEAIKLIDKTNEEFADRAFAKIKDIEGEHNPRKFSLKTLEALEAVNAMRHELFEAKRLIEKFNKKHQPEIQTFK